MTGPFATADRRSLLLRMAGQGYALAKYLKRSNTGMRNVFIAGHVDGILATQEKLNPTNGETEIPKGFEILEEVERV